MYSFLEISTSYGCEVKEDESTVSSYREYTSSVFHIRDSRTRVRTSVSLRSDRIDLGLGFKGSK